MRMRSPEAGPWRDRRPAPDDDVSRHDGSAADTDPVSDDGAVSDTGGAENHVLSESDTRIDGRAPFDHCSGPNAYSRGDKRAWMDGRRKLEAHRTHDVTELEACGVVAEAHDDTVDSLFPQPLELVPAAKHWRIKEHCPGTLGMHVIEEAGEFELVTQTHDIGNDHSMTAGAPDYDLGSHTRTSMFCRSQ